MLSGLAAMLILTPRLDTACREAADAAIAKFSEIKLQADEVAITVAVLDRSVGRAEQGGYRGDASFYPASVVKMFYMAYAENLLERGALKRSPEFDRAIKDMIVDSSNDATGLILDIVTRTTGGPELPEKELKAWMDKRQAVNKWYAAAGYAGVNACQKTWNEGPYGRERQGYGPNFELRNALTTDACVRLMSEIAFRRVKGVSRPASYTEMETLMRRDIGGDNYQEKAFSGGALPKDATLYSKAGWTSAVRHDVAWVKLATGKEYVWAIFTKNHAGNAELMPYLAGELLKRLP